MLIVKPSKSSHSLERRHSSMRRNHLLKKLFVDFIGGNTLTCFKVIFWDGTDKILGKGSIPEFVVHLKTKDVLKRIFHDLSLGFGEGYMDGDIEFKGDLRKVIQQGYFMSDNAGKTYNSNTKKMLLSLSQRNTKKKDMRYISHHYDLGNDFYKLWLDDNMVYSCAYFHNNDDKLEDAQRQKMEYCCKKLRLKPTDTLLDIGCGWGGLLLNAAKKYGISGTGITLSREQAKFVTSRIKREGLQDRISIEYLDYRELESLGKRFNKIVSVGMFEHVGKKNIKKFLDITGKVLAPGGMFLLHTIGKITAQPTDPWLKKYIFPGGYIPGLTEIYQAAWNVRFKFIDLEDLRTHYGRTLDEWLKRFEDQRDVIEKMFGERFVRMWRFYLAASSASFWHGNMHLFQFLFSQDVLNDLPPTRAWMTEK